MGPARTMVPPILSSPYFFTISPDPLYTYHSQVKGKASCSNEEQGLLFLSHPSLCSFPVPGGGRNSLSKAGISTCTGILPPKTCLDYISFSSPIPTLLLPTKVCRPWGPQEDLCLFVILNQQVLSFSFDYYISEKNMFVIW